MQNWDDLRVFLAAARRKSYQAAGAQIGLDATTVGRRIARLEQALRCTLLVRGPSGHALTAAGQKLFEVASGIEAVTDGVNEAVVGDGGWGVVRLSTSEGFGTTIIAPALPELLAKTDNLAVEIVANPGFLSAATREADVAITLSATRDARLAVERLTDYRLGLYAAPGYLEAHGVPSSPGDVARHRLVGYIDDLIYANELRYMDEVHPNLCPTLTSSSIRAQLEMIAAGSGLGVLPCFLATSSGLPLVRLLPGEISLTRTFWMSARRDVQQTRRVRTVRAWIRDTVARRRELLLP